MTDEQVLRDALTRRYVVEVEYGDGGSETISGGLPIWGCLNFAKDSAVAWGQEYRDTFFIATLEGVKIMKLEWRNDVQGYQWSVVDADK